MSNRRKRRAREAQARADQILRSAVRMDGVGEDPAIRAFLTKMPTASQSEAVELALALDRYLRGDESVMDNPKYADHINKMRSRAAEIEDAERRWAEDPVKFYDDVWKIAEKNIATGDRKARMEATAAKMLQDARIMATANKETQKLRLDHMIRTGPVEDVAFPGIMKVAMENGTPVPRLLPLEIKVMHRSWVLKPGMNLNVPSVFATRYREIKRVMDEKQAREDALKAGMRAKDLEAAQEKIDLQYGSKRASEYKGQLLVSDNAR